MKKLEELTLTFGRERVRFDSGGAEDEPSMAILECRQPADQSATELFGPFVSRDVIVKCESLRTDFVEGLDYRFYGSWTEHQKHGRQFVAKTFVRTQPHGHAGVVRYLMQAPHVGRATAQKLWERFGGDAVRMLRSQPDVAAAAVGGQFSDTRAAEAAEYLAREQAIEETTIDLIDLLSGRGFPRDTGKRAVAEWGNVSAKLIRQNPYLLMRFRGCGFLRCDQLYIDLGGSPDKLKRQALCAWYSIARDTNGHTWHMPAMVEGGLRERIAGTAVRAVDAVKLAKRGRLLAVHRNGDGRAWIADARKAANESLVAARVRDWMQEPSCWPALADLDVSDHQREKLSDALTSPIAIFTGGPGTGKTFSAARVIAKLIGSYGTEQVAVAAPTGKAAVRISEVMAGYGLAIRARTIHSLLGVASRTEGDGWGFQHCESDPLPQKFIVVDESSMIDCDLAASLFRACGAGSHVLLVGDTGQLPPVGHGAPLRDLIAAGVPCGELTEIRRNSGRIVASCHEIREGRPFRTSAELDPVSGENLKVLPAINGKAAIEKTIQTIRKMAGRRLVNPIWDCQVIVAVNAKSDLSRRDVNLRMQAELNPGGLRVADNPFRTGDKIVCLKNGFFPVVEDAPQEFNQGATDGKVFVANGEQASVKHVEPKLTIAQLDSPSRMIKIPRGSSQEEPAGDGANETSSAGCQWDLAYAISCHKSQGSEWPVVFVALDEYPGARMVCSREWIYTAMSRAKLACFLVGKLATAHGMIQREAIRKRKTFLRELICGPENRERTTEGGVACGETVCAEA